MGIWLNYKTNLTSDSEKILDQPVDSSTFYEIFTRELHYLFYFFPVDGFVTVSFTIFTFRFRIVRAFFKTALCIFPQFIAFTAKVSFAGVMMRRAIYIDESFQYNKLFVFRFFQQYSPWYSG